MYEDVAFCNYLGLLLVLCTGAAVGTATATSAATITVIVAIVDKTASAFNPTLKLELVSAFCREPTFEALCLRSRSAEIVRDKGKTVEHSSEDLLFALGRVQEAATCG